MLRGAFAQSNENVSLALDLPVDQAFEEWLDVGRQLSTANRVLNWWIGDWWASGSHHYGERAKVAAEGIFGRDYNTLSDYASVCRSFEVTRRRVSLSFTHHREVAGLSPSKADDLLDRAEQDGWSTRELRAEVLLVRQVSPRWFERREPKQFDRKLAKELIYDRLVQAAETGELCPGADELAALSDVGSVSTTVELMQALEREHRIEITRFQRSRMVKITETGQSTAEPENKVAHWRDRKEDVPAPTIHELRKRCPAMASEIESDALSEGRAIQDHVCDLVWIGHSEYRAERERGE